MLIHTVEEVDEPLAGDVVAEEDERHGAGIDYECSDVVHVGESIRCVSFHCSVKFVLFKTYFSPFCKFPMPSVHFCQCLKSDTGTNLSKKIKIVRCEMDENEKQYIHLHHWHD